MRYLLNIVNDNVLYNGKNKINILNKKDLLGSIQYLNSNDECFIISGPCSYSSSRKAIAIGKALSFNNIQVYGIELLVDYLGLFSNKAAFIYKNHVWLKEEKCIVEPIGNSNTEERVSEKFVCNQSFGKAKIIECTTEEIFNHLDRLKIPLKQHYSDRFANN